MTSFEGAGGHALPSGPKTNPEFPNTIMEILHGGVEALLRQRHENVIKTNAKRRVPIPPIPLETLVVFGFGS